MAKSKNYNPADAYRKAQRKKELAKNREARKQAKEIATVKKDTSGYEEEIAKLVEQEKSGTPLTPAQKARLSDLRSEVERINKAKEAFVEAHPEQRRLVYRNRASKAAAADKENEVREDRSLFGRNGLPLHPERSIYYDPVMNPYGMPPPGMPYVERPPTPVEEEEDSMSEDEDEDEDEDDVDEEEDLEEDIPMPPGMSDAEDSGSEALEDIPLPPGPPPTKIMPQPPLPPGPAPYPLRQPPVYMGMPMMPMPMMSMPGYGSIQFATAYSAPVTYSAPGMTTLRSPPPSLPAKPMSKPPPPPVEAPPQTYKQEPLPPSTLPPSSATISAPAALRDFKAEATAFVPSTIKRRQATQAK